MPANNSPAPSGSPKKVRGRLLVTGLGIAGLIAAGTWGVHWWNTARFVESTDDAYLQADNVVVAPKVAGYVAEVFVQANQLVKKGDPLVRLDNRQYQAQADLAQATIAARQADIAKAQADIQQQRAQIEQAQAQEQASRFAAAHAKAEYDRYAPLVPSGAVSAEKAAELRNARDQAEATLMASVAAVKSARGQVTANQAQVAQAEAQVKAAEASQRQSRLDVDDTLLRAAIDGRIGDTSVRVGQYAQPGTRMMSLVPVQQLYLVANFKETQIGRMRIGQPVVLHVDALPGLDLHGVVESFSPGTGAQFALLPPENATGNFTKIVQRVPVRIRVEANADTRAVLLPGLSVTTQVDTRASGHAVAPASPANTPGPTPADARGETPERHG